MEFLTYRRHGSAELEETLGWKYTIMNFFNQMSMYDCLQTRLVSFFKIIP